MNRAWICAVLFVLYFSGAVSAQEQEHAAMIKSAAGQVRVVRQDQTFPARVGILLYDGDLVVSAPAGYAGIMFTDGTVITLGPGTSFRINTYVFSPETGEYDFFFYLEKGSAVYHSGKIGRLSPESVKLETPKATVGIRGTRFIVKVD
ncbi:MAG: FecR family protein [Desulfobacter sp.]